MTASENLDLIQRLETHFQWVASISIVWALRNKNCVNE